MPVCAPWYAQDCLNPASNHQSSLYFLAMPQFHWELFARGMGSYKHNTPNTPMGTCAMLGAAAVTFIQTQEEEKEQEKEVVVMSSS